MILLEVAVRAPVHQTYSYGLSDELSGFSGEPAELIGRRLMVPFGNRPVIGFGIGVSDVAEPAYTIRPVLDIVDPVPLFPALLVSFFRWIAEYYHYPIGQVIATALPGGLTASPARTVCLTSTCSDRSIGRFPRKFHDAPWLSALLKHGELSESESRVLLSGLRPAGDLRELVEAGLVEIRTRIGRDRVGRRQETCYRLVATAAGQSGGTGAPSAAPVGGAAPSDLSRAELKCFSLLAELAGLSGRQEVPRKELLKRYPHGKAVIKRLIDKNLVVPVTRRVFRSPFGDLLPFYPRPDRLSEEQEAALAEVVKAVDAASYQPFLLCGVTGSGKTEVYLRAAEHTLAGGRSVLVLVPEIALATQIEAHFVSRFKDRVALLHSGLSRGERYDEWWRALTGAAGIVIGARSAVFAPLADPGLIIVDEEHDASFKQEDGLRYHGRDLAIVRAKQHGCPILLGSATPSVTSYYHAGSGKYRLLRMNSRIGGQKLPGVEVIDLKSGPGGAQSLFHPNLRQALSETVAQRNQAILLLNRRGFSTAVICRVCGSMIECGHCRITMNLHRSRQILLCHYCGHQVAANTVCGTCGASDLHPLGVGTERVAEQVGELLPDARVARLDSDVAADRKAYLEILQGMRERQIDVLVGTQMIAKGLHFPGVTLVGIVMADSGLGFPDFRAGERTYQLLAQVTGRAGRGMEEGRVIIQTLQPGHYAIQLAAGHRYQDLVETELAIREAARFPPFSRLVFMLVEDMDEKTASEVCGRLADEARRWTRRHDRRGDVEILGPAPAPLEKLRDRYRWQVLLKGYNLATLHEATDYLLTCCTRPKSARLHVDVDPETML